MKGNTVPVPGRIAWRAWSLEASWHPRRLQGAGALFALMPVLRRGIDPAAAVQRHGAPFNANTWMAPAALGAIARLEQDGRGQDAVRVRDVVSPVLSGLGDAYVFQAVRPACIALAVTGAFVGHPVPALAAAFGLYAVAALAQIGRGFARGATLGGDVGRAVAQLRPPLGVAHFARFIVALAAGAWATGGLAQAWQAGPSNAFILGGTLCVGYTAARRQRSAALLFAGLVVLAILLRRFSNPVGLP